MYKNIIIILLLPFLLLTGCFEEENEKDVICNNGDILPCYTGEDQYRGVGVCIIGYKVCSDNRWGTECIGDVLPSEEICDGLDNNCDGEIDNGLETGDLSSKQDGVCEGSKKVCGGGDGWVDPDFTEITGYEATEVSCDGIDNDCDGETDNNLEDKLGTNQNGVCENSLKICDGENGWKEPVLTDIVGYEATEISCDGKDNDCDGEIDNNLEDKLGTNQNGVCENSLKICDGVNGWKEPVLTNIANYEATEISCDGKDNDCDGTIDIICGLNSHCATAENRLVCECDETFYFDIEFGCVKYQIDSCQLLTTSVTGVENDHIVNIEHPVHAIVNVRDLTERDYQSDHIIAQLGYRSTDGGDLSFPDGFTWLDGDFIGRYLEVNHKYSVNFPTDVVDSYNYLFRFSVAGGDWVYCDENGVVEDTTMIGYGYADVTYNVDPFIQFFDKVKVDYATNTVVNGEYSYYTDNMGSPVYKKDDPENEIYIFYNTSLLQWIISSDFEPISQFPTGYYYSSVQTNTVPEEYWFEFIEQGNGDFGPLLENIQYLEYKPLVGETVTIKYEFIDNEGDQDQSEISWYRLDPETGASLIEGETSKSYILTKEDVGCEIYAEILPKDGRGGEGSLAMTPSTGSILPFSNHKILKDDTNGAILGLKTKFKSNGDMVVGYIVPESMSYNLRLISINSEGVIEEIHSQYIDYPIYDFDISSTGDIILGYGEMMEGMQLNILYIPTDGFPNTIGGFYDPNNFVVAFKNDDTPIIILEEYDRTAVYQYNFDNSAWDLNVGLLTTPPSDPSEYMKFEIDQNGNGYLGYCEYGSAGCTIVKYGNDFTSRTNNFAEGSGCDNFIMKLIKKDNVDTISYGCLEEDFGYRFYFYDGIEWNQEGNPLYLSPESEVKGYEYDDNDKFLPLVYEMGEIYLYKYDENEISWQINSIIGAHYGLVGEGGQLPIDLPGVNKGQYEEDSLAGAFADIVHDSDGSIYTLFSNIWLKIYKRVE